MRGTPLGKKHTLAWSSLGFRALVRALGLFQTFSWAHYSKLFSIDKIVLSMELGIPDFVRYKMGVSTVRDEPIKGRARSC